MCICIQPITGFIIAYKNMLHWASGWLNKWAVSLPIISISRPVYLHSLCGSCACFRVSQHKQIALCRSLNDSQQGARVPRYPSISKQVLSLSFSLTPPVCQSVGSKGPGPLHYVSINQLTLWEQPIATPLMFNGSSHEINGPVSEDNITLTAEQALVIGRTS